MSLPGQNPIKPVFGPKIAYFWWFWRATALGFQAKP